MKQMTRGPRREPLVDETPGAPRTDNCGTVGNIGAACTQFVAARSASKTPPRCGGSNVCAHASSELQQKLPALIFAV
jgi:hypothetical protein